MMLETLTQRMKRVRKEKKLTLVDLSLRMNIHQGTISHFEKGKVSPTAQQADMIRAFLSGKL